MNQWDLVLGKDPQGHGTPGTHIHRIHGTGKFT